jgi:hypothetical protein
MGTYKAVPLAGMVHDDPDTLTHMFSQTELAHQAKVAIVWYGLALGTCFAWNIKPEGFKRPVQTLTKSFFI